MHVDARSLGEYEGKDVRGDRGGHIPGAVHADLDRDQVSLEKLTGEPAAADPPQQPDESDPPPAGNALPDDPADGPADPGEFNTLSIEYAWGCSACEWVNQ